MRRRTRMIIASLPPRWLAGPVVHRAYVIGHADGYDTGMERQRKPEAKAVYCAAAAPTSEMGCTPAAPPSACRAGTRLSRHRRMPVDRSVSGYGDSMITSSILASTPPIGGGTAAPRRWTRPRAPRLRAGHHGQSPARRRAQSCWAVNPGSVGVGFLYRSVLDLTAY